MATRVTDGARRERLFFSSRAAALVSHVSRLRRSRAPSLLSLNLKKKKDCSQSINPRLLLAKLKAYGFCPDALDTRHNYNVKWPNFELTWARDRRGDKFYSPSLNSDAIPSLQFQPNFPTFTWLGIRAKKFHRTRSPFFSDVFIGVAVVGS